MFRPLAFTCILIFSLIQFIQITGCSDEYYDEVTLDLYSLILPGRTDTQTEVVAKFTWHGGG